MRDFLDTILQFIGSESLTDEEYAGTANQGLSQAYTLKVYTALKSIVSGREEVSTQLDKLKFFFQAKGLAIDTPATTAKSNLFFGGDLSNIEAYTAPPPVTVSGGDTGGGGGGTPSDAITALTGDVTATGPGSAAAVVSNVSVISKVLTGFAASAGTVTASDTIKTAFQKIVGNLAALLSTVTGLSSDVAVVESDLSTAEGNITTLQGNVSTINTSLATLAPKDSPTFSTKSVFSFATATTLAVFNSLKELVSLADGTDGQVLTQVSGSPAWVNAPSAPIQSVSNVGAGSGVSKGLNGTAAELKSLVAGTGITLTPGTNDITVSSTASGATISGTDNRVVRVDGTTGIQDSSLLIDDLASDTVCLRPVAASLAISVDGTAKTSPGGTSGWLDFFIGAGRMRFIHASYSATIGAVEWSALRVFHRIPICFDGTYGIGKRTDGALERPTEVHVANWIGVNAGTNPTASTYAEFTGTEGAVLFPRMTTTQRDALTAVNGMVIYNISVDKLQVRAAGAWVDLH